MSTESLEKFTKVYTVGWDVGAHTGFTGKIAPTISTAIERGMYTVQFFLGNPKSAWKRQQITDEDIENVRILTRKFPMHIFSHYPYCANLAGQSKVGGLAWRDNRLVTSRLRGAMKAIQYELSVLAKFRTSTSRAGVVIHPGSYPDRSLGHDTVTKTLNLMDFPKQSILLLENCAGEGNKLCRTIEELQQVISGLNDDAKPHVKVCIDTAHIWGQGDYDLRDIVQIDRLFSDIDRLLGMENFYLLHLNDSAVPFGSRKDVHASLGEGYIWRDDFTSLIYLLNRCKAHNIPMVLETCCEDMITLAQLQPNQE